MATGFIMPMCMARVAGIDNSTIELIQKSYESFGIAWRLLDDINDMEEDVKKKWRSAIYHSLPQNFQYLWNIKNMNKRYNKIAEILIKDAVLYRIIKKILLELKIAEKYSKKAGLEELAIEFSELYAPLVAMIEHD
jgi:CRISPR/Cas system CMR-associated protein Cmr5 small subunit